MNTLAAAASLWDAAAASGNEGSSIVARLMMSLATMLLVSGDTRWRTTSQTIEKNNATSDQINRVTAIIRAACATIPQRSNASIARSYGT